MSLITFLALLLDMGKAKGGLTEALVYLKTFIDKVKADLPDDAADLIGPIADELYMEIQGKVPIEDLQKIVEDVIKFVVSGKLGTPDRSAGGVI